VQSSLLGNNFQQGIPEVAALVRQERERGGQPGYIPMGPTFTQRPFLEQPSYPTRSYPDGTAPRRTNSGWTDGEADGAPDGASDGEGFDDRWNPQRQGYNQNGAWPPDGYP